MGFGMTSVHPSRSDRPAETRPRPAAAPPAPGPTGDVEWDDLLLGSFGPRHWNLGCG